MTSIPALLSMIVSRGSLYMTRRKSDDGFVTEMTFLSQLIRTGTQRVHRGELDADFQGMLEELRRVLRIEQ